MRISQQISAHDDRIVLLHFEGDLNASDCEATSKIFQGIIDSKKYFIVALMENVTFVSSPFLGELMGCKLRLVEKGGNMVIVGQSLDVAGFHRVLIVTAVLFFVGGAVSFAGIRTPKPAAGSPRQPATTP